MSPQHVPLGTLALQAGLIDQRQLDDTLRAQADKRSKGEFPKLGELLVERYEGRCTRDALRGLLAGQGIVLVACELCASRYNALHSKGGVRCLRCGSPLRPCEATAPLAVEDTVADPGPDTERVLSEFHQRNPARVGRFLVLGEVGRGAMGTIYKAWEQANARYVALKFLRNAGALPYEDRSRFRREAELLIRLQHPSIVSAHAIEEEGDLAYIVMEFLRGVPLNVLIQRDSVKPDALVELGVKLARALQYTHDSGLVHRDIKSANVVVNGDGSPFLVDFGIAKNSMESMSLTNEGEVLGTLAYMDPLYLSQGPDALDLHCDVYGLAVILYEGLSGGTFPYGDPAAEDAVVKIMKQKPTALRKIAPDVPKALAKVIDRALSKKRATRYPDAEAFAVALEGCV